MWDKKKTLKWKIICLNEVYIFSIEYFLTRCIFYVLILNLNNLKSVCGKKDAFDCAGIRAQVFRLPVDCSTRKKMCSWYKETHRCSSYIINYPNHKYGWYNLKNTCTQHELHRRLTSSPHDNLFVSLSSTVLQLKIISNYLVEFVSGQWQKFRI